MQLAWSRRLARVKDGRHHGVMEAPDPAQLRDEILRRARLAGPLKSICPSEVARGLSETWRPLMTPVREAAILLVLAGRLEILRHGKPVADLAALRGVIRLRIKPDG